MEEKMSKSKSTPKYIFQINISTKLAGDNPPYHNLETLSSERKEFIHPRLAIINGLPHEILAIKDAEQFSEGGYTWIKVKTDPDETLAHLMKDEYPPDNFQVGQDIVLAGHVLRVKDIKDSRGTRKIILEPIHEECSDAESSKNKFEELKKKYSFIEKV